MIATAHNRLWTSLADNLGVDVTPAGSQRAAVCRCRRQVGPHTVDQTQCLNRSSNVFHNRMPWPAIGDDCGAAHRQIESTATGNGWTTAAAGSRQGRRGVASALSAAYAVGVVAHRDVKPPAILIAETVHWQSNSPDRTARLGSVLWCSDCERQDSVTLSCRLGPDLSI